MQVPYDVIIPPVRCIGCAVALWHSLWTTRLPNLK